MRRQVVLEEIIVPIVEALGCTFVGLEYLPQGRALLLRLYVDKPDGGVTIDDCERISRQVNAVLEVKAVIQGAYTLEVSSPGLDRLLFIPDHFREQLGNLIFVRIVAAIQGRRNFKGILESADEDSVSIRLQEATQSDETNDVVKLSFTDIVEARLVPKWDESKGKKEAKGRKKRTGKKKK